MFLDKIKNLIICSFFLTAPKINKKKSCVPKTFVENSKDFSKLDCPVDNICLEPEEQESTNQCNNKPNVFGCDALGHGKLFGDRTIYKIQVGDIFVYDIDIDFKSQAESTEWQRDNLTSAIFMAHVESSHLPTTIKAFCRPIIEKNKEVIKDAFGTTSCNNNTFYNDGFQNVPVKVVKNLTNSNLVFSSLDKSKLLIRDGMGKSLILDKGEKLSEMFTNYTGEDYNVFHIDINLDNIPSLSAEKQSFFQDKNQALCSEGHYCSGTLYNQDEDLPSTIEGLLSATSCIPNEYSERNRSFNGRNCQVLRKIVNQFCPPEYCSYSGFLNRKNDVSRKVNLCITDEKGEIIAHIADLFKHNGRNWDSGCENDSGSTSLISSMACKKGEICNGWTPENQGFLCLPSCEKDNECHRGCVSTKFNIKENIAECGKNKGCFREDKKGNCIKHAKKKMERFCKKQIIENRNELLFELLQTPCPNGQSLDPRMFSFIKTNPNLSHKDFLSLLMSNTNTNNTSQHRILNNLNLLGNTSFFESFHLSGDFVFLRINHVIGIESTILAIAILGLWIKIIQALFSSFSMFNNKRSISYHELKQNINTSSLEETFDPFDKGIGSLNESSMFIFQSLLDFENIEQKTQFKIYCSTDTKEKKEKSAKKRYEKKLDRVSEKFVENLLKKSGLNSVVEFRKNNHNKKNIKDFNIEENEENEENGENEEDEEDEATKKMFKNIKDSENWSKDEKKEFLTTINTKELVEGPAILSILYYAFLEIQPKSGLKEEEFIEYLKKKVLEKKNKLKPKNEMKNLDGQSNESTIVEKNNYDEQLLNFLFTGISDNKEKLDSSEKDFYTMKLKSFLEERNSSSYDLNKLTLNEKKIKSLLSHNDIKSLLRFAQSVEVAAEDRKGYESVFLAILHVLKIITSKEMIILFSVFSMCYLGIKAQSDISKVSLGIKEAPDYIQSILQNNSDNPHAKFTALKYLSILQLKKKEAQLWVKQEFPSGINFPYETSLGLKAASLFLCTCWLIWCWYKYFNKIEVKNVEELQTLKKGSTKKKIQHMMVCAIKKIIAPLLAYGITIASASQIISALRNTEFELTQPLN